MEKDSTDWLLKLKTKCSKIAPVLLNADDEKFKETFEKLYKMDKQYLGVFIRSHLDEITEPQFEYAKKRYETDSYNVSWQKTK